MAKLPTYSAPEVAATPSGGRRATAADFSSADFYGNSELVGAGHQVQKAAGEYLTDLEDTEARQTLVQSTALRADYARKLDEAAISGADVGALKEQMVNDFSKVGDNYQTRKGADSLAVATSQTEIMFDQQANSIKVQRAMSQAKLDGQKFLIDASKLIQSNPAYLDVATQNAKDLAATYTGITPEHRATISDGLVKDLNMAAAISSARIDPTGTRKALDEGKWDLTPEQRNIAINKSETEERLLKTDERYQRTLDREDKLDRNEKAQDRNYSEIMAGTATRRSIMDDPDLRPSTREHLINVMETRALPYAVSPPRTDPAVFNALRAQIDLPQDDPRKLKDTNDVWSKYGHGLAEADAARLERRIIENRTDSGQKWSSAESEAIRNLKPQLDKSTMLKMDEGGGERVQAFTIHLRDRAKELQDKHEDPYTLLRPDSKNYIGRDIPLFQSPAQRSQADIAADLNKALAPKTPAARRTLDEIFNPAKQGK